MPKATTSTKPIKAKAVKPVAGGVPVYNLKAEKTGEIALPKSVFAAPVRLDLIALAIRVYLANRRRSHAKVKDIGEVSGTTKKMWAQKGTGRARHGSSKFGLFVGGASSHGPTGKQNFKLKMNLRTKKLAFNSVLSRFAKENAILVIDDFSSLSSKTKEAQKLIELFKKNNQILSASKKIGVITAAPEENVTRAFRNISGINLLSLKSLNTYTLANNNFLIFNRKAVEMLK